MDSLSRRELFLLGFAVASGLVSADEAGSPDVHRQILDLAARFEKERRARFAAVDTKAGLEALQGELRRTFLERLGGLSRPTGVPTITKTGRIEDEDYVVEKLVFESFPGYFVPALLYKPKTLAGPAPGVLSPCGHSEVGKAADPYQILHINLAKRGCVVLTYDPVGQGERSQFWDVETKRSRFNLTCGEHAVLGNPLYLLGTGLARYRILDGLRGIDYLMSLPEVDAKRIGCVGNSGGGNLTAYLTALDPRVSAAAICCYITTLPRRMANRIQDDPDADPEQDIFGFVSEGIDHAGLLALCAPRPTLLGTARFDFFPIEGARESLAEAKRLYEVVGAGERITRVESASKHGLSLTLREAVYHWFGRWLLGRDTPDDREIPVKPRRPEELRVCAEGQVNVTFRSKPFLPLAWDEFRKQEKPARKMLRELLRLDLDQAAPKIHRITADPGPGKTLILCINGNESPDWKQETAFLRAIERAGHAIAVVDPRGVGSSRLPFRVGNNDYADPLSGVEENVAYNAFLVGRSLMGMRVSDVLTAVRTLVADHKPQHVILCGRRDAALVAVFAASLEPTIQGVAAEGMLGSYKSLFSSEGSAINAASIVPGLLRDFGDIPDVLAEIGPRKILIAAGVGEMERRIPSVRYADTPFTKDPSVLTGWLRS